MKIMGLGINYSDGTLLVPSIDEQLFAHALLDSFARNAGALGRTAAATDAGDRYRDEVKAKIVDPNDPRAAGWTFLVNGSDPQKDALVQALRPLAELRGMKNVAAPLVYNGEGPDAWQTWLADNYSALVPGRRPHYILIVGGPQQVPFLFQSFLAVSASVGRVAFDSLHDLQTYVDKLIRLESLAEPVVKRETIFFAPDAGNRDATYYSHNYMAAPLAAEAHDELKFTTNALVAAAATKANFLNACRSASPALVYTASHGSGAPSESLATQQQVNGAICCQHAATEKREQWLFRGADVPDGPFLEGAVFFQFACFSYGTPAQSDFAHWYPDLPRVNASADFVAALPKKLLAHPRGPIAFIGHVDIALLHGFDDPDHPVPELGKPWNNRIEPFLSAVEQLLGASTVGQAMSDMSARYNQGNAALANTADKFQRGLLTITPEYQSNLASAFLMRTDAQNYLIFGDPAAHLRIPDA